MTIAVKDTPMINTEMHTIARYVSEFINYNCIIVRYENMGG